MTVIAKISLGYVIYQVLHCRIKLFPIGKEPVRFRGGRDLESLKDFVTKTLTNADEDEKEDKDVPPLEVNEGLYEISSENFDNHIASGNHFIKFFAPWCGHCKKMEPAWKELAENFKNSDRVKIGNVNFILFKFERNRGIIFDFAMFLGV